MRCAHYRTYYIPSNAFIVCVGDFDSAELAAQIERRLRPDPARRDAAAGARHRAGAARRAARRAASAKPSCRSSPWPITCPTCAAPTPPRSKCWPPSFGRQERAPASASGLRAAPGARRRRQLRLHLARSRPVHRLRAAAAGQVRRQRRNGAAREIERAARRAADAARAGEGEERHRSRLRLRPGLALLPGACCSASTSSPATGGASTTTCPASAPSPPMTSQRVAAPI